MYIVRLHLDTVRVGGEPTLPPVCVVTIVTNTPRVVIVVQVTDGASTGVENVPGCVGHTGVIGTGEGRLLQFRLVWRCWCSVGVQMTGGYLSSLESWYPGEHGLLYCAQGRLFRDTHVIYGVV